MSAPIYDIAWMAGEIQRLQAENARIPAMTIQHQELSNALDASRELASEAIAQIADLGRQIADLREAVTTADLALTIAVSWAGFTLDHWDNCRCSTVGKCLAAMNGSLKGHAPDTDAFHAYRQKVHEARKRADVR